MDEVLVFDKGYNMLPYNKRFVSNARTLRKNMTPEEKKLWYDFLKKLPYNVRRQHNIENYIVDFYIAKKKLVIEIDGIQHTSEEHKREDELRDKKLSEWGIIVLRYTNIEINTNFFAVKNDILLKLDLQPNDLI